ncbi:TPA: AzlC family ABC transporter permease [Klebsiella variicola]|nr:AzlC family ABC transporter permease [Klebsiella variicola]HCI9594538.1 AzlC family ABC transporter permease [Klebsiella variicola]HCI9594591.1 AzlC family ABC transporter permease [Klebsiella variicola]
MSEQYVDASPDSSPQDEVQNRVKEIRRGLKDGLPVLLGVIPFALVLGAQASHKGLSSIEVPLMTGLNFAGGSEFAAIQIWGSPPSLLLVMAVTLLVNSRHILMGATLVPLLSHLPKRKILPALFFMTDESWALSYNDAQSKKNKSTAYFSMPYYLGVSLSFYSMWVFCTTLGALIGPVFGDVHRYGFDMAFPAVFLVLVRGMWNGWRKAIPWIISLIVSVAACHLISGLWYVIAGPLSGLAVAAFTGDNGD